MELILTNIRWYKNLFRIDGKRLALQGKGAVILLQRTGGLPLVLKH